MEKLFSFLLRFVVRLLVGATPRFLGDCIPKGQAIYFANHTSHIDAIAIWSAIPNTERKFVHPVAAKDYWGKTKFRKFIAVNSLNSVLLDREIKNQNPLSDLISILANGESLILFPEGTRSQEQEPKEFKAGIYSLAKQFPHVQLIPIYLDNFNRCMPKGSFIPVPLACSVRFGNPLFIEPSENKKDFLSRIRKAVITLS